jgi:hypothetical protein
MAYSTNGIAWTGLGTAIFSTSGQDTGYGYGNGVWVAIGQGLNGLSYSTNAINWTGLGTSTFTVGRAVKYANGLFVIAGSNSHGYSTDGSNWSGVGNTIFSTGGYDVDYNPFQNLWVSAGMGVNSIAYSTDAFNWTGRGTTVYTT